MIVTWQAGTDARQRRYILPAGGYGNAQQISKRTVTFYESVTMLNYRDRNLHEHTRVSPPTEIPSGHTPEFAVMKMPRHVEKLSESAGCEWSPAEVRTMKEWLSEPSQIRSVSLYAGRYLGKCSTPQDVEDAVVEFYALLDNVVRSYRPGGPSFWHYMVHVCFKHYCVREGDRLRKRLGREASLDVEGAEVQYSAQIIDTRVEGSPPRMAQSSAFADDLAEFLNGKNLPEQQLRVFVLRYIEDMPYDRIAEEVGSPVGSVKGWLNRATMSARAYLSARGWSEWQPGN